MRLSYLLTCSLVLSLACGDKGDTTGGGSTDATSGDTTAAQTTDQTGPATTGATSGASTGAATTQTTDQCGGFDSCGVTVEMSSAVCEDSGALQASTGGVQPPSLSATYLDTDRVAVQETGFEATCCLTLTPELVIETGTITVTYAESGDPCDCICNYTIDYILRKVPKGDWTLVSGPLSADFTVP